MFGEQARGMSIWGVGGYIYGKEAMQVRVEKGGRYVWEGMTNEYVENGGGDLEEDVSLLSGWEKVGLKDMWIRR